MLRTTKSITRWLGSLIWPPTLQNDLARIHQHVRSDPATIAGTFTMLELMTIVLEDKRFFNHPGVDARSVVREVIKVLTFQKHGGASTIDMQFVRTVTGYRAKTMRRKLYEAILACAIQFRYEKRVILRSYLDCAFFGSGLIGADMAAQKVFGKDAHQLGLDEAAFIGAMLACPRPLRGSPKWERRVRRRAAYGMEIFASGKERFTGPYELTAVR